MASNIDKMLLGGVPVGQLITLVVEPTPPRSYYDSDGTLVGFRKRSSNPKMFNVVEEKET